MQMLGDRYPSEKVANQNGEGKTFVAMLPAYLRVLSGQKSILLPIIAI